MKKLEVFTLPPFCHLHSPAMLSTMQVRLVGRVRDGIRVVIRMVIEG